MSLPDQSMARHIIEKVGQGIPPTYGVEYFSAGLDSYLRTIENEYLEAYIKEGGSTFKAIIAGYGQGKTHFLFSVRNLAWKHNYATSYVMLSPEETPFHNLELVYKAIVRRLSYPPPSYGAATDEEGLDAFLKHWYSAKEAEFREKGLSEDEIREALKAYTSSIVGFESTSFTRAIRSAFMFLHEGKDQEFENVVQWLKGEGYDRRIHSNYGILHKIDRSQAFPMIRSLTEWIRWTGYSGLVILFDEIERHPSFSTKQRELILNNLRQLIDETTNPIFKGALIFYSLPDEAFLTSRGGVYEALKQRLETIFDFTNPTGVKLYLENLTTEPTELLREIGWKLSQIYQIAYSCRFDEKTLKESIKNLAEACYELRYAGAHRRLFVQKAIQSFHLIRSNPGITIDKKRAQDMAKG